jgi:hypothetical protein
MRSETDREESTGSMQPVDMMKALLELADAAKLEVRVAGGNAYGDPEFATASGVCRLRDATWVVLSQTDSVDVQVEVLADALRTHASDLLQERYLPPAVRELLFGASRQPG